MTNEPTRAIGTGRCRCSGCGRSFGGVAAFDRHQQRAKDGLAVCLDPSERALMDRNGWGGRVAPDHSAFAGQRGQAKPDETTERDIRQGVLL